MMVKKKQLEIFLSKVSDNPSPNPFTEQYETPPELAANLLYTAAYTFNDIIDKTICDLGCGSGRLAIGAAYLDAKLVVGIDSDRVSISTAKANAEKLNVKPDWVIGDIDLLKGKFDTVVENPPFGVRRRGADMKFLAKALSISDTVYSIHKSGEKNRRFIADFVARKLNAAAKIIGEAELLIPHLFSFHRKEKYKVKIDIYRIVKR